jgi:hypothetical protein
MEALHKTGGRQSAARTPHLRVRADFDLDCSHPRSVPLDARSYQTLPRRGISLCPQARCPRFSEPHAGRGDSQSAPCR